MQYGTSKVWNQSKFLFSRYVNNLGLHGWPILTSNELWSPPIKWNIHMQSIRSIPLFCNVFNNKYRLRNQNGNKTCANSFLFHIFMIITPSTKYSQQTCSQNHHDKSCSMTRRLKYFQCTTTYSRKVILLYSLFEKSIYWITWIILTHHS